MDAHTVGGSLSAAPRCPPCGTDSGLDDQARQLTIRLLPTPSDAKRIVGDPGRGGWGAPYRAWFVVEPQFASSLHAARFLVAIISQGLAGGSPSSGRGPLSPSRVSSRAGYRPPAAPRALRVSKVRGSPRGLSRHGESPGDFRSARQVSPTGEPAPKGAVTPSEVCETTRSEAKCVEQPLTDYGEEKSRRICDRAVRMYGDEQGAIRRAPAAIPWRMVNWRAWSSKPESVPHGGSGGLHAVTAPDCMCKIRYNYVC
jgi:hypothetical protein